MLKIKLMMNKGEKKDLKWCEKLGYSASENSDFFTSSGIRASRKMEVTKSIMISLTGTLFHLVYLIKSDCPAERREELINVLICPCLLSIIAMCSQKLSFMSNIGFLTISSGNIEATVQASVWWRLYKCPKRWTCRQFSGLKRKKRIQSTFLFGRCTQV